MLLLLFARLGHKKRSRLRQSRMSLTASYLVYLKANTLSCLSYETLVTSYHLTLQRYAYYLNNQIFFKVFLGHLIFLVPPS